MYIYINILVLIYMDIEDKLFFNKLFYSNRFELLLVVFILFFFNLKIGLIGLILYGLIYSLNNYEYSTININQIKQTRLNNLNLNKKCRVATMNNPTANYNIGEDPNITSCTDDINLKNMEEYNQVNVYENASEKTAGSFNKSLRDFYTTSTTEYPNNSMTFANWLYNDIDLTCKINNNCFQYDDIRYHSR